MSEARADDRVPFIAAYYEEFGTPEKASIPDPTRLPDCWTELPDDLRTSLLAAGRGFRYGLSSMRVTGWRPDRFQRWTDRGLQWLPGWWVRFTELEPALPVLDAVGHGPVLQVESHQAAFPSRLWVPDGFASADGFTLEVRFRGYAEEFCDYAEARVVESDRAVTFDGVGRWRIGVDWVEDYAEFRRVSIRLRSPLGGRVVIGRPPSPLIISPVQDREHYPSWPQQQTP